MSRPTVLLAACVVALAACGSAPEPAGRDGRDPRDLLLRVDVRGGLVPAEVALTTPPAFSLYADGTIVYPGPQIEIYPPPALPALVRRTVSPAGIDAIVDRAVAAGLVGPDRSFDTMLITDAPTTTFTIVRDGDEHVTAAYALGESAGLDLPPGEADARHELLALQADLFDLVSWLPDGSLGPESGYRPQALALYVGPSRSDPGLPQDPIRWPLASPLDEVAATPAAGGLTCGVVEGPDLARLLPALEGANTLTPWVDGERRSSILPRPLLPDESGC